MGFFFFHYIFFFFEKLHFKPYNFKSKKLSLEVLNSNKLNPEDSKSNKLNPTISKVTNETLVLLIWVEV